MADDNSQNRMSNPSERGTQSGGQNSDPLAELARLIGQNDPFADFGRDQRAQPPAPQKPHPSEPPLAVPSFFDTRDKSGAPPSQMPIQSEQSPPAFIQAASERSAYRDAVYRDSGHVPPDHDFDADAEPRGRGRKFMTLTAVVALAVLGVTGAFGYRFMFGDSGSAAPPRVIHANPEPTKVPPPTANADQNQSKSTYDRVGGAQGERLVSREEIPVDINSQTRPGLGRNLPPQGSSQPNMPGTAPSAMGESKRVRTVTIRADQSEASMAPTSLTPPTAAAPPATAPRTAPPPSAAAQQRATAVAPQAAPQITNTPLALTDDSSSTSARRQVSAAPTASAQPRAVQQRSAQPAQPLQEAAPAPQKTPQALAQIAAPKGVGFLVQVSSQRNETDAQAALRTLQGKFPNVLGGQQATIRRAELGERGVFYRALIGPYATRDQATQLCVNLKAAGGDCVVQGN